ncbi:MAG: SagB/ThcOx family dehydrogenase [Bacteroidales bacterium]|nr:SagB/ThcOx family dehydrogenase [Bacteroidales bacterium]
MKNLLIIVSLLFTTTLFSQSKVSISLNKPNTERGLSVMKALSLRASASKFDPTPLAMQDLSDLLWASNGVNRPESGKRTAPSAINAQDIDIYVFNSEGVYLYNAQNHTLELVVTEDNRKIISNQDKDTYPPVILLLVSDIARFRRGDDATKAEWAAMDAGIVSQNTLLFCASAGMEARPRAFMNKEQIRELLNLNSNQLPMLNIPVSYKQR